MTVQFSYYWAWLMLPSIAVGEGMGNSSDCPIYSILARIQANLQTEFLRPPDDVIPSWQVVIAPVGYVHMACAHAMSLAKGRAVSPEAFQRKFNITSTKDGARPLLRRTDLPESFLLEMQDKHRRDLEFFRHAQAKGLLVQLLSPERAD